MIKAEKTETSPITGQDSVIVEHVNEIESKVCMDSGYMTTEDFKFENVEKLTKYEESMPQLIVDTKYKDDDLGQYWYLTTIQFKTGMIYPQPTKHSEYEWAFTPIMQLDAEEKLQFPVPGKHNEYYESRLATEHTELYKKYNFKATCQRAGAVINA